MTIGERVAYIRQLSNLSQEEFAERINISQSHLSNVEKGRKPLTAKLCKLICLEFMVREEWLWSEKGDIYITETRGIQNNRNVIYAITLAKQLYDIMPDLYRSCENVHSFLKLFKDPAFCNLFNTIARIHTLMPEEYTKFAAMALYGFDPVADVKEYDDEMRRVASRKYADDPFVHFLDGFRFDDDWVKEDMDELVRLLNTDDDKHK